MTEDRLPLADLLAKAGDADFLRSVAEAVLQMLMEADVEGLIGAGRHERTGERLNYRNGFRDRTLDTRLGAARDRRPAHRPLRSEDLLGDFPQEPGEACSPAPRPGWGNLSEAAHCTRAHCAKVVSRHRTRRSLPWPSSP